MAARKRNGVAILGRAAILGGSDLATRTVMVPQWGGAVTIRELSVAAMVDWQEKFGFGMPERTDDDPLRLSCGLVVRCVVGEDGAALFTDEDIEAIAGRSAAAVQTVYRACLEINGLAAASDGDAEKN